MVEAEELIKKLRTEGRLVLYYLRGDKIRKRTLVFDPDDPARCKVLYMDSDLISNVFLIEEFVPQLISHGEAQPNYWLAYVEALKAKDKADG
jgi:hypothetical protein